MRRRGWLVVSASAVAVVTLLWLVIDGQPEGDSSVFAYVAQGLLDGELPWVDRWDHKGPSIYLVNAVGLLLTPGSWLGLHALEMAALIGSGLLGFTALRPAFGTAAAAFAMVVVGLTVAALTGPGNFTEEWTLLPQFATLYLFTRVAAAETFGRREALALLAIGALGAVAFLFRPNLVGLWLAVGIYWLILGPSRGRRIGLAVVGGLATLALFVAGIITGGAWDGYVDAVFTYNRVYAGALDPRTWLAGSLAWLNDSGQVFVGWQMVPVIALGWVAMAAVSLRPVTTRERALPLVRWAALAAPIEILLLNVGGRAYTHYYLALIPVLAVLTAFVARYVIGYFGRPQTGDATRWDAARTSAFAGAALGAAWLTLVVVGPVPTTLKAARPYELKLHDRVARYVQAETDPGETVFIWGGEPLVLLLSERESPTRFFYQRPLMTQGFVTDELIASVVAELESDPPALVIDTRDPVLPPLDQLARVGFQPSSEYSADPAILEPIFEFVETGYSRVPDIGPWAIYQRR